MGIPFHVIMIVIILIAVFSMESTLSKLVFFCFSQCTDVLKELRQPLSTLRDGRSSRSAAIPRQIVELHGGKRHPHHTVSNHIEKSPWSLSSVPVHKGKGRIPRGLSSSPFCAVFLSLCMSLFFVRLVHKTENVEGHCCSIGHRGFVQRSLHSQKALRQKSFAFRMLLRSRWHRSRTHSCSGMTTTDAVFCWH